MSDKKVNIVLVDDHSMVREGLRSLIESIKEFNVIASLDSGKGIYSILEDHSIDVAILDIMMPDENGLEVAKKVKSRFPEVGILILSMEVSTEYVKKAYQYEVDGYLPKNADMDVLVEAIRAIDKGERYYDKEIKEYIFNFFVDADSIKVPKIDKLSDREVQVLKLIAEGVTNKEIGNKLYISAKTVEAHRNNILKKLGLNSTADLVKFSIAKNLTSIPKDMTMD